LHSESEIATGSAVYVDGLPHDSWRDFLPYYIAKYKGSSFTISRDQMQYWYRLSAASAGSTCGVVGNNAEQGQTQLSPNAVLEDGIFFSALLMSAAEVRVQIGNGPVVVKSGVAGINHWSIPFNGQIGTPYFSVWRSGKLVKGANGGAIKATPLSNGCTNYNPYVGSF
jgi:glucan endo-1,3-alpha-glucosidase